ncbi:M48 family metalloprotease [Halorubrum rubrum]|uniref:M48 family metalloprotease n=1 Tax=Halorubrum rubrum TaxID=1126240 RepID=UPI002112B538|nr:M48 family metalloprotease [Halorubrum rubrum]
MEAVLAHELAHATNRDATVMAVVSLPVVPANGLGSRLADVESPGWAAIVVDPPA